MRLSDFNYELPVELIAQVPLKQRDASRMLVLDRTKKSWLDSSFASLNQFLKAGDVLVLNNTRVFPARLIGRRHPSGGRVEVLLTRRHDEQLWEALVRPAHRLHEGDRLSFPGDVRAEVIEVLEKGLRLLEFDGNVDQILDEHGETPLPPYIKRDVGATAADKERYQTIYARNRGAVAAPTAGLHFTETVIENLKNMGVELIQITLHVGYGTFEPVRVEDVTAHRVAPEVFEINEETAAIINRASAEKRRVVAVGTTTTRALESAANDTGEVRATSGLAETTITPGYSFRVIDALLTNFHLPQSSLLLLVCALGGNELVMNAYRHAVSERYRFYSYGDCMLIL